MKEQITWCQAILQHGRIWVSHAVLPSKLRKVSIGQQARARSAALINFLSLLQIQSLKKDLLKLVILTVVACALFASFCGTPKKRSHDTDHSDPSLTSPLAQNPTRYSTSSVAAVTAVSTSPKYFKPNLYRKSGYIRHDPGGRFSNGILRLEHALLVAKFTGRTVFVLPLTHSKQKGVRNEVFSLEWLQILDLDSIHRSLDPRAPKCVIRGWNDGPPHPSVQAYMNGSRYSDSDCPRYSDWDAPPLLRRPSSWGASCRVLPWFLMPAALDRRGFDKTHWDNKEVKSHSFPDDWCVKSFGTKALRSAPNHVLHFGGYSILRLVPSGIVNETYAHEHELCENAGIVSEIVDGLDFCQFLKRQPLPLAPLEFNGFIKQSASQLLGDIESVDGHAPPVACFHIRRGDFNGRAKHGINDSLPTLAEWIQLARILQTQNQTRILIITNSSESETIELQNGIPGAVFGCNPSLYPSCRHPGLKAATEQESCAQSDLFFGTFASTFSLRINRLRAVKSKYLSNVFVRNDSRLSVGATAYPVKAT
ncbi:hypothetical protein BJ741DRAFT_58958 [Chytriomyces cf. hyalinus JEL632]|nr:hypothetical protein BJ741DRAFT_58958 [Chytriomyces cf. hyalinus JEL632]